MDDDLDLSQLRSADTPELVRPAFSRFRRRIILVGILVAMIAGVIGVGITYARTSSPELRLRRFAADLPAKLYTIKEGGSGSDRWAIFVHDGPQKEFGPCIRSAGAISTDPYCPLERHIGEEAGKSVDYTTEQTGSVAIDDTIVAATVVVGIAPLNVMKVTVVMKDSRPLIKNEDSNSAHARASGFWTLATHKLDGFPYRFFGDIIQTSREIDRVDAFDRSGRLIPPNPFADARDIQPDQYGALNDHQRRAADAAVEASSDKDAVVLYSHGPYPLSRALSMMQAAVMPEYDGRQAFVVELAGEFEWKRFALQDGKTSSRFAFSLVEADSMKIIYSSEQPRWHGPPASDLIRASLEAEPNQ